MGLIWLHELCLHVSYNDVAEYTLTLLVFPGVNLVTYELCLHVSYNDVTVITVYTLFVCECYIVGLHQYTYRDNSN